MIYITLMINRMYMYVYTYITHVFRVCVQCTIMSFRYLQYPEKAVYATYYYVCLMPLFCISRTKESHTLLSLALDVAHCKRRLCCYFQPDASTILGCWRTETKSTQQLQTRITSVTGPPHHPTSHNVTSKEKTDQKITLQYCDCKAVHL